MSLGVYNRDKFKDLQHSTVDYVYYAVWLLMTSHVTCVGRLR